MSGSNIRLQSMQWNRANRRGVIEKSYPFIVALENISRLSTLYMSEKDTICYPDKMPPDLFNVKPRSWAS
jgi:hypothetical protein